MIYNPHLVGNHFDPKKSSNITLLFLVKLFLASRRIYVVVFKFFEKKMLQFFLPHLGCLFRKKICWRMFWVKCDFLTDVQSLLVFYPQDCNKSLVQQQQVHQCFTQIFRLVFFNFKRLDDTDCRHVILTSTQTQMYCPLSNQGWSL